MARGSRVHRLPQRLDYALIPAPLDLSLPLASEKDALPSIIVTPSSPTHGPEAGYFLAFLAPPPKPTLRTRLTRRIGALCAFQREQPVKLCTSPAPDGASGFSIVSGPEPAPSCLPSALQFRARTTVLLLLLLFIMACHLLTHRLAAARPHLDFAGVAFAGAAQDGPVMLPSAAAGDGSWWDLQWLWDAGAAAPDEKRDFVVEAFPTLSVHI